MLKEDIFFKECSFEVILAFANSEAEKQRAKLNNLNLRYAPYPLTKKFLQEYYNSKNYSNLKNTFNDINCAADVYSFFIMTYGKTIQTGSGSGSSASAGQSSGLNPLSPYKLNLGFNFGETGLLIWLLLAGVVIYKVSK